MNRLANELQDFFDIMMAVSYNFSLMQLNKQLT